MEGKTAELNWEIWTNEFCYNKEIGLKCAYLEDGPRSVVVEDGHSNVHNTQESDCNDVNDLLDYQKYCNASTSKSYSYDLVSTMAKICSAFELSFLQVKHSQPVAFTPNTNQYIPHTLPIICVVQMFNLLIHQMCNCTNASLQGQYFLCFDPSYFGRQKFLLYVPLDSLLKADNFSSISTKVSKVNDVKPSENEQGYYLLRLNEFAGRVRGDRCRHPIVPWVVDFSSETACAQLNEQFSSISGAYHVPELLSDICYMAYRARREPKKELCKYVRSSWVPEEYPPTIARLFSWTPDECIPEFYEDPQIFKSLHNDMVDLGTPDWITSPEDFIVWHRDRMESEEVSSKLHKWIDLAFGYLLSGNDAIEALNTHLSFVKSPSCVRKQGAVKLFNKPHPRRLVFTKTETINATSSQTQESTNQSFDLQTILQDIYKFHENKEPGTEDSLMSIGVTIIELALAEYCRDLSADASFKDRLIRAQRLLTKSQKLPRSIAGCFSNEKHEYSPGFKSFVESRNFMQTSVKSSQLTNSFISFFCIPASVILAHELLADFHSFDHLIATCSSNLNDFKNNSILGAHKIQQIEILWLCFELTELSDLWLNLYVELMKCNKSAATVCQKLFGRAAEFCNRDVLVKRLVPVMKRLFEGTTPNSFDRRFILQLCIRFGTSTFFLHFLPLLVEAVLLTSDSIHEVARDTILWLSKRFGPIVTASHITINLLRLLAVCYTDSSQKLPEFDQISAIYGPAFITLQYLPFCSDIIDQAMRKLTSPLESALIGCVVMLKDVCDCLSDRQIMDNLQDLIIDQILFPALIACRIGGENVQTYMSGLVQRIFCTFNLIYDLDESKGGILVAQNAPNSNLASSPILSSSPLSILSSSLQNGNRLSSFFMGGDSPLEATQDILSTSFDPSSNMALNSKMGNDNCSQLTDSWVDHFRSLATFQGHTSEISKIMVLDNETRLSLAHKTKPSIVGPVRGSAILQLDWPLSSNSNEIEVGALAAISNHVFAAASNAESIVRTVDVRTGQLPSTCAHPLSRLQRLSNARTGRILSHYALPHTDTTQVSWISEKNFASVHENHPAMIWTDSPKIRMERRLSEVATMLTPCA
uniref:BEACH domain-containing protein n=1 Tax=Ditylenchus dipsaci TaxID=166011 RepID=A0A915E7T4_9BILA